MAILVAFLLLGGLTIVASHREDAPCSQNYFYCCKTKECIPSINVCDGILHCKDMTDELHCPNVSLKKLPCSEEEFRCLNADWCIQSEFHCDSFADCPDGSDELNCTNSPNKRKAPGISFLKTLSYAVPPFLIIVILLLCHQASQRRRAAPWLTSHHAEPVERREITSTDDDRPLVLPMPEGNDNYIPTETPVQPPKYEVAISEEVYDLPETIQQSPSGHPPPYDSPLTVSLPPDHLPPPYQLEPAESDGINNQNVKA